MKKTALSILLLFSLSSVYSQADHPSLTLYNGDITGARQTPLYLGNWTAAAGTTNFMPSISFSTSDINGQGTLDIHANRWSHNFLVTRGDPNGTYNLMQVIGQANVGTTVSVYDKNNQTAVSFNSNGDSYFNGGNLAIGTTSAFGYKLAVNGTAIFTKAIVKPYPWSDYVFDQDYRLPALDSVGRFIGAHHHLPDMPSADSVAVAGIDIGNNQSLLLKKIEELTLYAIAQQKEIDELKKTVKKLAKKK
ncbi:MAG TPA: hypothetical protein VK518_06430 [Puia sp.]|nr:hypothetical protein [Puia sp.]